MASIQEKDSLMFTGWKDAKETLKDIRDNGTRDSRKVTFLGNILVTKYASKLGDEGIGGCQPVFWFSLITIFLFIVWTIHEQLVPAALDIGDFKTAEVCIYCLGLTCMIALIIRFIACCMIYYIIVSLSAIHS